MKLRFAILPAALLAAAAVLAGTAGCGGSPPESVVPSLGGSGGASASANPLGAGPERRAALHEAAECIRRHGIPNYQDPVLTSDGHVYTDARSYEDAEESARTAAQQACGTKIRAAGLKPDEQAPAPPALVQAGVKVAQCMRANGLPNYKDPTANTHFTPGHGFGLPEGALPNDDKRAPGAHRGLTACRSLIDEEVRQSSLGNLGHP